ncbi:transposase [Gemmiger sp.]
MGGQHLTWKDRIAIESLLKAKVSVPRIAAVVGCSKRTVYREIQRGQCEQIKGRTYEMYTIYSAQKAQNHADKMNDLHKGRPVKLCPELAVYLEDYIGSRHYSPAAAVREILLQGLALPKISTSTAYRYIYRGYLHLCGLDLPVGRYNVKQKQDEQRPAKSHKDDHSIDDRPRLKPARM